MAVKKVPVKYEAEDGREFDSKLEAERYDALTTAQRSFDDALELLNRRMCENLKTADGHVFSFSKWTYFVVHQWSMHDAIVRVNLHAHECAVHLKYGDAIVQTQYRDGKHQQDTFYMKDLYAEEINAKKRLLELKRERYQELSDEMAKLEKEILGH